MSINTFFRIGSLTISGLLLAGVLARPTFAETKKLDSVGLTVGDLGNPFFVQIAHGAESRAKQINDKMKFTALSSNYDVNNQTNQIDNFISSNVNLILLGAADSKGIAPAVMRAKQAGVTVVAVDVGAEGGQARRRRFPQMGQVEEVLDGAQHGEVVVGRGRARTGPGKRDRREDRHQRSDGRVQTRAPAGGASRHRGVAAQPGAGPAPPGPARCDGGGGRGRRAAAVRRWLV